MKKIRVAIFAPALAIALSSCSTPPIKDNLTLVPVSNKADRDSGIDIAYIYGTNQGYFNHVACGQTHTCWYSGNLETTGTNQNRMNSIVVKGRANSHIYWARSYQINDAYTSALGLLSAPDEDTLLYGNSIVPQGGTNNYGEPVYELLGPNGKPKWGGAILIGNIESWSAFTDATRLKSGGYALTGSSKIYGKWWSGTLIKLDPDGRVAWAYLVRSQKEDTLTQYLTQLGNKHILLLGYNAATKDLVFFEFNSNGKLLKAPIVHIRGTEAPVGLVPVNNGIAAVAQETMPSGESAALIILLDSNGKIEKAVRYRYPDGFNPYDVIAMPGHGMCIYGRTEAKDKPQSLTFTLDAKLNSVSALAMKDDNVFVSGTLLPPNQLIFSGARKIGTDSRWTSMITRWNPSLMNQENILKQIQRAQIKIKVYKDAQGGETNAMTRFKINFFPASKLKSRIIYDPNKSIEMIHNGAN